MSDTPDRETDPIGHGDQYDRPTPDARDDEPIAAEVDPDGDAASGETVDGPIVGQEPDPGDAAESPDEASTDAAGRDI